MPNFFKELKQRKVIQAGGFYIVAAWVIIQVMDILFEALELPNWVLLTVFIILFTGFPIVLIIAWIFERTAEGKVVMDKKDEDVRPIAKRKRTWFAVAGIVAGLIGGIMVSQLWITDNQAAGTAIDVNGKSIAVLPFSSFTKSDEDVSFADGIHDDILTQLAKIGDLKVVSRTSVMEYKDTKKNMRQIATELGVSHIIEGSVRRAGNRIRIVSQLIKAATDEHLWAETYDRDYADIFAVQTDVAIKIAKAMHATLTPKEKAYLEEIPTSNMDAYDNYLKGKYYWDNYINLEGNSKAAEFYEEAGRLDPTFIQAFARASITHSVVWQWVEPGQKEERKLLAYNALEKAALLDSDHPMVHYANGWYSESILNDRSSAIQHYEMAIEQMPNNAELMVRLAVQYFMQDQNNRSIDYLLQAKEINPNGIEEDMLLTNYYRSLRDFEKADFHIRNAMKNYPEVINFYRTGGMIQLHGYGNTKGARSFLEKAKKINDDHLQIDLLEYDILQYERKFEELIPLAKKIKSRPRYRGSVLGIAYTLNGDDEKANEEWIKLRRELELALSKDPNNKDIIYGLITNKARTGKYEEAMADIQTIIPEYVDEEIDLLFLKSRVYVLSQKNDMAMATIKALLNKNSYMTLWRLKLSPEFDSLRNEPEFITLVSVTDR